MPDVSIARRTFKDLANTIGAAEQGQPPPVVASTSEADQDGCPAFQHAGALRPFDHGDGVGGWLIKTGSDPANPSEPVEVVVLDGQPPPVPVMQDKGRAVHAGRHAE